MGTARRVLIWLHLAALLGLSGLTGVRPRGARDERGDVPGWVLVTVMSAGLVMAIWGAAQGQLTDMLSRALSSVK